MTGPAAPDELGLFPEPDRPPASPADTRSAGQRRRDRQAEAVAMGQHPLVATLHTLIPLHTHAVRALDTPEDGPRCGNCALRRLIRGGDRPFPKCTAHPVPRSRTVGGRTYRWEEYPRATGSVGTDVNRRWPACIDYQPEEG